MKHPVKPTINGRNPSRPVPFVETGCREFGMSNEPSVATILAPENHPADAPKCRHRGSRWPNPITIGVSDLRPRALKRRLREGGGIRAE